MQMMITGASKGIGAACKKRFENCYDIISIARTGDMTENGDLTCPEFRDMIVSKYENIDVLINNAGILSEDALMTYELNQIAACHLMEAYAKRGTQIINIGSAAGYWNASTSSISDKHLYYSVSKSALKKFAGFITAKYKVKITTLEPRRVSGTAMGKDSKLNAEYIAELIEWILKQPIIIESIHFRGE